MSTPLRTARTAEPEGAHLDVSWILPNLAMGGRFAAAAVAHLVRGLGIRNIVDLRCEDKDDESLLRRHAAELLHLPTLDGSAVASDMLHRGVEWINRQLDRGEKVLVHCEQGIGRSALLVCCVLVSRGRTPRLAIEQVKDARPCAAPSPEQLRALLEWTAEWCRAQRAPRPPDTLADLTAIAYRHLTRRSTTAADPPRWFRF